MSTAIICCDTLEDELKRLLAETGLDYPVVWVEAGLHNQPDKLRAKLNEELAKIKGVDRVLMALGHCGGACVSLAGGDYEMVLFKSDDCLSVLLGSLARRREVSRESATYFMTDGWLRHSGNIVSSFARDSERFGPQRAERIYKLMLKHYQNFGFIETGTYDVEAAEKKVRPLSAMLGVGHRRLASDLSWLRRLLTGPWDTEEFLVVPPRTTVTAPMWDWLGDSPTTQ